MTEDDLLGEITPDEIRNLVRLAESSLRFVGMDVAPPKMQVDFYCMMMAICARRMCTLGMASAASGSLDGLKASVAKFKANNPDTM